MAPEMRNESALTRSALRDRLEAFVQDAGSRWLRVYWDDSDSWPIGSQLREVFDEEFYGGLRLVEYIRFIELLPDDRIRRIVAHLCEGLAEGRLLPATRQAEAARLAQDLADYFGRATKWQITYEERGRWDRFMSSISGAQYGGLLVARNDSDVLVLFAADQERDEDDYDLVEPAPAG